LEIEIIFAKIVNQILVITCKNMWCYKEPKILPKTNALQPIPNFIKEMLTGLSKFSKKFLKNIRKYNSALALHLCLQILMPK
jgi:hypothetical protein